MEGWFSFSTTDWIYFTQCLTSFFLYQSSSSSLCTVFDSVSSNIDEVLLINSSANVFLSLETLMYVMRTDLSILVELFDLVNSVIILLSQMTLLRWLTLLLGSQTVIPIVQLFWIYLFLLMQVFVLQWLSLHWEMLIMSLSQFILTFHQVHNEMPCFVA